MRRPIVAANWKMHKTLGEADTYFRRLMTLVPEVPEVDLVICPPYTALHAAQRALAGRPIYLGAQSARPEREGAFTGEISLAQVKELGATHVICGHSERRALFGEDDQLVARKVWSSMEHGLVPILCVGETLEQRESGNAWSVVEGQIAAALGELELSDPASLVVAYEPIWAIGTGVSAQPTDAQEMAARARRWLVARFGTIGQQVRVQYGGSVNRDNAASFLGCDDVDGALVGGASLDPDNFWKIAQAAVG